MCGSYSREETIQGRKLFKGGNYLLLGGFDRGNYSKEESIQGRKLYEEMVQPKINSLSCFVRNLNKVRP